jgi:D-glycero-D-manno-heptose 1,7-bisphosphate phosphatase
MNKAIFLDRDGVINRKPKEGDYITSWADFHLLSGVAEGIALLNRTGYMAVVVTNQRCVAKGLLSAAQLETMHEQMQSSMEFITAHTITSRHVLAASPRLECFSKPLADTASILARLG